jgi:hypothetical protein
VNWIDYILVCYEREIAIILSILLIVFNIANLYSIIDFLSYDGIVVYRTDEGLKYADPYVFVHILLATALFNLLFVIVALYARITKDY